MEFQQKGEDFGLLGSGERSFYIRDEMASITRSAADSLDYTVFPVRSNTMETMNPLHHKSDA